MSKPTVRTIVGLEIHVQLLTRTKLFCGCLVEPDAPPNTHVCPMCLGLPGALPVLNRQALDLAVLAGLALDCTIARQTKWDRKSYHYPDLPKNYQISQYDLPLAEHGHFDLPVGGEHQRIRIKRAHLEEDAGKNMHAADCTLVDLNRTGTPLLEIVTEPDITSADVAFAFCTELQRLVTYLGVSEGIMQKGQMRFEPNVNLSIEHEGDVFYTPISEIKNLNSFRAVRGAIAYETERQLAAWLEDHDYVKGSRSNENRGWDDDAGATVYQRPKEAAHDYRYFPDPDLPFVEITDAMLDPIRDKLTELPLARRVRLTEQYGLSVSDVILIVDHRETADLFEAVVARGASPEVACKQFVNTWLKLAKQREVRVIELGVGAERMAELVDMTVSGTVSKTAAGQIAEALLSRSESPSGLAEALGLIQVQDEEAMATWVAEALAANEKAVSDALVNPKKAKAAVGFLRGQVMRISGGKANPKLVGELIEQRLDDLRDG